MAKPQKVKVDEIHKCYYCTGVIESLNDLVIKKYPVAIKGRVVQRNRKFHMNCLFKYHEQVEDHDIRTQENSDWDKVYQYFRNEILQYPMTHNLSDHTVRRLLGMRLGMYYPDGNNTRILPRGYSFEVILVTLKVIKVKVLKYLADGEFKDENHKINAIMKILQSEINDVHKRMERQKKANAKVEEEQVEELFDYKGKLQETLSRVEKNGDVKSDGGLSSEVNDLFKGLI